MLSEREKINIEIQEILDRHTDPWGVKVSMVEVKHIDLPTEMNVPLPARPKRNAKEESKSSTLKASIKGDTLSEAAAIIAEHPMALQLRFLRHWSRWLQKRIPQQYSLCQLI